MNIGKNGSSFSNQDSIPDSSPRVPYGQPKRPLEDWLNEKVPEFVFRFSSSQEKYVRFHEELKIELQKIFDQYDQRVDFVYGAIANGSTNMGSNGAYYHDLPGREFLKSLQSMDVKTFNIILKDMDLEGISTKIEQFLLSENQEKIGTGLKNFAETTELSEFLKKKLENYKTLDITHIVNVLKAEEFDHVDDLDLIEPDDWKDIKGLTGKERLVLKKAFTK